MSAAAALANYTAAPATPPPPYSHSAQHSHAPANSPTVTIPPLSGHSSFLSISFHESGKRDDKFMFWLPGSGGNHGNAETPKHDEGRGRGESRERRRQPEREKLAPPRKLRASLYLSQTTLICSRFALAKYIGGKYNAAWVKLFLCRSEKNVNTVYVSQIFTAQVLKKKNCLCQLY